MEPIASKATMQEPEEKPSRAMSTNRVSSSLFTQQTSVTTSKSLGSLITTTTELWFLALLFLANQAGCHVAAPGDITIRERDPRVEYYWNCGLNTAYVTLRLFHKDVNIYKLADELKVGAYLGRNVSLLDLKKAFEKYGLTAEGFKADYPEEIIGFAQPESILIIYVDSYLIDQKIGHFIAIKGGRHHVIMIDPPYHPKKFTKQGIIEGGILSNASGELLLVYDLAVLSPTAKEKGK